MKTSSPTRKQMTIIALACAGAIVLMAGTIALLSYLNPENPKKSDSQLRSEAQSSKQIGIDAEEKGDNKAAIAAYTTARDRCKAVDDTDCVMDMESKITLLTTSTADSPSKDSDSEAAAAPDPASHSDGTKPY